VLDIWEGVELRFDEMLTTLPGIHHHHILPRAELAALQDAPASRHIRDHRRHHPGPVRHGPDTRLPGFYLPSGLHDQLDLVANIGLTLFLFIIGLEVDLRFLLGNWKVALNVGLASMAIPFGFGCAIAVGLYNQFKDEAGTVAIDFPVFMLFIGVAMAITVCSPSVYENAR
jgi:hypothetical protein